MIQIFHSKIINNHELRLTRIFLLISLFSLISIKGLGQQLTADFSASSTSICSGSSVIFTDNSTGTSVLTAYSWNFGAGALPATATGKGPHTVTYTGSGTSTVSLTITDTVSDTKTIADYITVNALSVVTFDGTLTPQCISSTIYTLSGGLPAGGTYSGAGVTGTNFDAGAAGLGTHTITYTFINLNSCADSATNTIAVVSVPTTPEVTVGDNCDGTSILFTTSPGTLLWSTAETTSSITVTTAEIYTVTTTVSGCTSSPGSGTAAPKTAPASPVVSIDCTLGNGNAVVNVTSPIGPGLEYRLDGGLYQSGSSFINVANGSHTITVRNASGCAITGSFFDVSCGCTNPSAVTLSSHSGSICGITPVTVSGNTFGGSAVRVTITEDGAGSVIPTIAYTSPFTFTYTPKIGDAGKIVTIKVTTVIPGGNACVPLFDTYILTVNGNPAAPLIGTITQPTCVLSTGSVVLNGLPSVGTWTLTRNPGGVITTGNGITKTESDLLTGIYTYKVTSIAGCNSGSSANVVIAAQPLIPTPPIVGTITQPACNVSTGSVVLSGLPASGTWTLTRNPDGITTPGTGTTSTLSGLSEGLYNFTVTNSGECTSVASADVVINIQPPTPAAPTVDTIASPTCALSTGSVLLKGLTATGTWTLTRYPGTVISTGTGISTTISDLSAGTYNFTLTNAAGCLSAPSANVIIPVQPVTPTAPAVGIITPACILSTGSVVLSGLPASGTWTLTRKPDGITTTGTGTTSTLSGLPEGSYNFTVTNSGGCISEASSDVVIPAQSASAIVIIITNPEAVCSPSKVDITDPTITAGSTPGLTYSYWTNIAGTIAFITPTAAGQDTYYIKGTETSGCFDIKPVTVTVNPSPSANAGTGGNNCGLEFYFNGSLNIGTGTWTKDSGPGNATFSPDANTSNASVIVTVYGTYIFRWTVVNGTCSNSATVTVKFLQQPTANGGTGGHECDKDFILNAAIPTGTGTWTKTSGPGTAVFTPDNHQPNAKVTVNQIGTYDFAWTVLSSICTSSDLVRVVFSDPPSINAGADTVICKGGSIQLHAKGTGSCAWIPTALLNNPNIADPVATPVTTTAFTVTLTDQFGCKNSDTVSVEVRNKPVPHAGPDQVLGFQFGASMNAELSYNYEKGIWSIISGGGKFIDATYAKSSVYGLSVGKNKFLWAVSNGVCPVSYDTVSIIVHDLIIPTLITPNMDGRNDYFVLQELSKLGKTELVIFDRRGAQVYKNANYNNSWNGVDYNGNPLPDDTYFYVLKTEIGKTVKGFIVIRR